MEERSEARWLLRACIALGAIAGAALAGEFVAGICAAFIALAGLAGGIAGALVGFSAAYKEYRGISSAGGEGACVKAKQSQEENQSVASPEPRGHVARLLEERGCTVHQQGGPSCER